MEQKQDAWDIIESRPDIAVYYRLGQEALSRTKNPKHRRIGDVMRTIAEAHDIAVSAVQAARKVAKLISKSELAELLVACGEARLKLGKEHVTLLATIDSAKERKKWTERLIKERFSIEDFRDALKDAYGNRGKGGNTDFEAPKNAKETYWTIRRFRSRFQKIAYMLLGYKGDSPLPPSLTPLLKDPKARKLFEGISTALCELEGVTAQLQLGDASLYTSSA